MSVRLRYLTGLIYPKDNISRFKHKDEFFKGENKKIFLSGKIVPVTFEHADVQTQILTGKKSHDKIYKHLKDTQQIIGRVLGFFNSKNGWKTLIGLHAFADISTARSLSLTCSQDEAFEVGIVFSPRLKDSNIEEIFFSDVTGLIEKMKPESATRRAHFESVKPILAALLNNEKMPRDLADSLKQDLDAALAKDEAAVNKIVAELDGRIEDMESFVSEQEDRQFKEFVKQYTDIMMDAGTGAIEVNSFEGGRPKNPRAYQEILYTMTAELHRARANKSTEEKKSPSAKRRRHEFHF